MVPFGSGRASRARGLCGRPWARQCGVGWLQSTATGTSSKVGLARAAGAGGPQKFRGTADARPERKACWSHARPRILRSENAGRPVVSQAPGESIDMLTALPDGPLGLVLHHAPVDTLLRLQRVCTHLRDLIHRDLESNQKLLAYTRKIGKVSAHTCFASRVVLSCSDVPCGRCHSG